METSRTNAQYKRNDRYNLLYEIEWILSVLWIFFVRQTRRYGNQALNVVIKCESLWGGHGKARKTVNFGFLFELLLSPHTTIVSVPYSARVWNDFGLYPVYLLPLWSRAVNNQVPITFQGNQLLIRELKNSFSSSEQTTTYSSMQTSSPTDVHNSRRSYS